VRALPYTCGPERGGGKTPKGNLERNCDTMKTYVGRKAGRSSEIFSARAEPTETTHGDRYAAVIGPFKGFAGARIMVAHGDGNPHIQGAWDADRMANSHHCDKCSPGNFDSLGNHRWAMRNA